MGQEGEMMMKKGPWTEQEDVQLVCYVNMFGDRRWDFIAKVSGLKVAGDTKIKSLKRSGKSCRLRWVNYLHPGLKRGKMTPHEERRILELHSKWGNRWSKIAQKLPGRTDNEIKNYWRTHMRKKAQEKKRVLSSSSSSLSKCSSSSSISTTNRTIDSIHMSETDERSFYDTGGLETTIIAKGKNNNKIKSTTTSVNDFSEGQEGYFSLDEIWKDIDILEDNSIRPVFETYSEVAHSPILDYSFNTFWMIDWQEEIGTNMFFPDNKRAI